MVKNTQLHFVIETQLLESLSKEASTNDISIAELCRRKLRENSQLDKIEWMLTQLLNKNK